MQLFIYFINNIFYILGYNYYSMLMKTLNTKNIMHYSKFILVLIFCVQISIGLGNYTFRKHKVIMHFYFYCNCLKSFSCTIYFIHFYRCITSYYIRTNIHGVLVLPSNKSYPTWTASQWRQTIGFAWVLVLVILYQEPFQITMSMKSTHIVIRVNQ